MICSIYSLEKERMREKYEEKLRCKINEGESYCSVSNLKNTEIKLNNKKSSRHYKRFKHYDSIEKAQENGYQRRLKVKNRLKSNNLWFSILVNDILLLKYFKNNGLKRIVRSLSEASKANIYSLKP